MESDKQRLTKGPVRIKVSKKLKYALLAFAMFFWLIGALFVGVGGYSVAQKHGFEELSDFATDPGIILCILGCIIFGVSSFGVLGSLRENIFLLNTYKYLLVFTLLFEIMTGMVGFAYWPEVKKMVDRNLAVAIEKYSTNVDLRNMIDTLQRYLHCCGSLTYDDWDSNPYFSCENIESYRSCGVPWSCCLTKYQRNRQCGYGVRNNRIQVKLANEIYTVGCLDKAFEFMKGSLLLVAGLAIAFTLPLLFGIFGSHWLKNQIVAQIAECNKQKVFI